MQYCFSWYIRAQYEDLKEASNICDRVPRPGWAYRSRNKPCYRSATAISSWDILVQLCILRTMTCHVGLLQTLSCDLKMLVSCSMKSPCPWAKSRKISWGVSAIHNCFLFLDLNNSNVIRFKGLGEIPCDQNCYRNSAINNINPYIYINNHISEIALTFCWCAWKKQNIRCCLFFGSLSFLTRLNPLDLGEFKTNTPVLGSEKATPAVFSKYFRADFTTNSSTYTKAYWKVGC